MLDGLRGGPVGPNGVMAIEPWSTVQVKFFGRCKGGWIRALVSSVTEVSSLSGPVDGTVNIRKEYL